MSAPVRLTGWRLAVTSLAFAAFVLQSFVVQTHIHITHEAAARLAAYVAAHAPERLAQQAGEGGHEKHPENDPANCPICQEILHCGQFVAPAAQVFLPPAMAVSTIAVVDKALPFIFALSHAWRGRAPPRI
ncbi:MAG: hypothetical protein ACLQUZ_01565 [Rhizomicrobium sp.]